MSDKRYTDEFKIEEVKQITERGHAVQDVALRLGVSCHSLYAWLKKYGKGTSRSMTGRPRFVVCVPNSSGSLRSVTS